MELNKNNVEVFLSIFKSLSKNILTWSTSFKVRISCISWSTSANSSVISGFTVCISSTITRIYTLFISTGQSSVTLWIGQAFIRFALYIWITLMSRWTSASSYVTAYGASGFDATLFIRTWILTFSLNASLC